MSQRQDLPGLRRSLHDAAERVPVPPVDAPALRDRGRLHARRQTAVTALVAAAVLAVVVGGGVALTQDATRQSAPGPAERTEQPDNPSTPAWPDQPATVEELPYGEPARVVAARGNVLYTPGRTTDVEERGRIRELALDGGIALAVHTVRGIVQVTPDGHLTDLGASGHDIAVSSNGRWAAWVISGQEQVRVMLWNLRRDDVEEVRALPLRGSCCDDPVAALDGVDNAGRVFVSAASEGTFVWDHRSDTVEQIDLLDGISIAQVVVDEVVLRSPPEEKGVPPRFTLGNVDEAGRFVGEQLVSGRRVVWSPDTRRPARLVRPGSGPVQVDGDRLEVLDPSTGDWRPMLVPSEVSLDRYLWEDGGHLLVTVHDSRERYSWLRCSALRGTCERVVGPGPEGEWVLPDR